MPREKIVLDGEMALQHGKTKIAKLADCLYYHSDKNKKHIPSDSRCPNKKGMLTSVLFSKDGVAYITATLNLMELKNFIKYTEKRIKECNDYDAFLVHLNPEISFVVTENKQKRRKNGKKKEVNKRR